MKFSSNWLKEITNHNLNLNDIVQQLTMAGLEVESVENACVDFEKVYCAKLIDTKPHPDANKLNICNVEYDNNILQIVCGDPKVAGRSNIKVALAINGARLQDGKIKIKKAKLRGIESNGMLCSKAELGLAESSDGIWFLPDEIPYNIDLYEYLNLNDNIIELSLTPNRGDCFSLRGIAREVCVLNNLDNNLNISSKITSDISDKLECIDSFNNIKIDIKNHQDCPKYIGRAIKNLDPNATTPLWMQERLRRSGIRSLYPLVDVTNYVMLELGQPMHAFDLSKIDTDIIVRRADDKEKLKLLDGNELELSNKDLVIADKSKILALAGIMGGEYSAINDHTTDVFLESAFFNPNVVAGRARNYGLVTDSSQRFERGVDYNITKSAIERATELLLEIAGSKDTIIDNILENSNQDILDKFSNIIDLRYSKIKKVLGIEINHSTVLNILSSLGLDLINQDLSKLIYKYQSPSHRFDLNIEEDIIEELARIYGYDNIPNVKPNRELIQESIDYNLELKDKIRNILSNRGYLEAITYSFIDNKLQDYFNFDKTKNIVKIINPISSEMNELRLSLIPGLLKIAKYNLNHQAESLKFYELGKCFYLDGDKNIEQNRLAGLLAGYSMAPNWADSSRKLDFYDAKGDLEVLFNSIGLELSKVSFISFDSANLISGLHPTRSALIKYQDKILGYIGVLHPQVSKKTNIDNSVILFELFLDELKNQYYTKSCNIYKEVSKMPIIRRDLAFLFKNDINVSELFDIVKHEVNDLLKNIYVFDIYQGEGIPDGHKSVAFAMFIQHGSKTLVDAEINAIIDKVINSISSKLQGEIRK